MMLLPLQANLPVTVPNTIPVEYSLSIVCQEEMMFDDERTFRLMEDNAMTSLVQMLKNRISEIGNLKENWDGYGAVPVQGTVLKNAFKFLDSVLTEDICLRDADDIVPTPYGSIVMDFNTDRGLVSAEIGETEIGFFTEFNDCDNFFSDGIKTDFRSIPEELFKAFDLLYGGNECISA